MSKEIRYFYTAPGPVYAFLLDSQSRAWDGSKLVPFDEMQRPTYAIPLAPLAQGSRLQAADMPPAPFGSYTAVLFLRLGDTPAANDSFLGAMSLEWDGKQIVSLATRAIWNPVADVNVVRFKGKDVPIDANGLLSVNIAKIGASDAAVDTMTELTIAAAVVEALRPLLPAPLTPSPDPQSAPANGGGG
jgi:hypothetical protein